MSKIMSVFEKLNLIEKVDKKESIDTNTENSPSEYAEVETSESPIEEDNTKEVPKVNETSNNCVKATSYDNNKSINEIYSIYNIANSNVNTVFMLGNFINALPENLPYDIKKNSVMNIINATNADLSKLLSDGENRLNVLNKYANEHYNATSKTVSEYKEEIIKLSRLIDKYKEQIDFKEAMLEEQKNIIKYEAQKIDGIISFFDDEV
jgi:uncharacterized phage infection (PIP) family protein YhgE